MISIITATNRQNPTFIHTVNCVMAQTYKDFEWVILDNSVNGYVKPFFEAYKQKYPQYSENFNKIKIFREYQLGKPVGYYKNKCVEYTTCKANEYVLVYDHDDFMTNTTLEDIAGCDRKYKEKVDYISGDLLFSYCNDDNNELILETEEGYNSFTGFDYMVYDSDDQIKLGDIVANGFTSVTFYGCNIGDFTTIMPTHPRAIKKHWLQTPMFDFYEGHNFEEDGLQIALAPLMLNVGWIARPTISYVIHVQNGEIINASKKGYSNFIDRKAHMCIDNARYMIFAAFNFFYSDKNKQIKFFRYEDFPKK